MHSTAANAARGQSPRPSRWRVRWKRYSSTFLPRLSVPFLPLLIEQSQLSRFVSGERGLIVDALERLADALELEIVVRPRRSRRKGR